MNRGRLVRVGDGPPRYLVVALYGYDSCGGEVAQVLADAAPRPGVVVVGPDGEVAASLGRRRRAWYPITSQVVTMAARATPVAAGLIPRIAAMADRHGVQWHRTYLVGFSQGTTIAAAILRQSAVCAGAVLVCGRLPPDLTGPARPREGPDSGGYRAPATMRPRCLVIAGERDPFVPPETVRADLAAGWLGRHARLVVLAGPGHELGPEAAVLAMEFATPPDESAQDIPAVTEEPRAFVQST